MLVRRNISTTNDTVNEILDSMPRGLRSNYIQDCILFKENFKNENYILKSEVESLIDEKLKTISINSTKQIIEKQNTPIQSSNKKNRTVSSILNL